ncbi:MAG: hypothetical protein C0436_04205 [Alphaproteobacteria bacterium]|nr:hypothetical protein [Alphaproteobacteria bacterium]
MSEPSTMPTATSNHVLFTWLFGLSVLLHCVSKSFVFYTHPVALVCAGVAGAIMLLFPSYLRAVLIACIVLLVYGWVTLPNQSNHTLLMLVMALGVCVSYSVIALRKRNVSIDYTAWFNVFAPYGRQLLVVLYFFGVFHKLNHDWFNHSVSCASVVWASTALPIPLWLKQLPLAQSGVMYGTLIVESLILVGLLIGGRATRYAVLCGVAFHGIIAINDYRAYWAFSAFSLTLHSLFLPAGTYERWGLRASFKWFRHKTRYIVAMLMLISCIPLLAWAREEGHNTIIHLFFAAFLIFTAWFLIRVAYATSSYQSPRHRILSPSIGMNLLGCLFFINATSPYIGLKTDMTLAMFSNLRTEFGQSNHYIITRPAALFPQLTDKVIILSSSYPPLQWRMREQFAFVHADFLAYMREHEKRIRGHSLEYSYNGTHHSIPFLESDNPLFRKQSILRTKLLSYQGVDISPNARCRD